MSEYRHWRRDDEEKLDYNFVILVLESLMELLIKIAERQKRSSSGGYARR